MPDTRSSRVARSGSRPALKAIVYLWKLPTRARASRRKISAAYSIRFSRPNRSGRAPVWACRCPTVSCASTAVASTCKARLAAVRPFAFSCRSVNNALRMARSFHTRAAKWRHALVSRRKTPHRDFRCTGRLLNARADVARGVRDAERLADLGAQVLVVPGFGQELVDRTAVDRVGDGAEVGIAAQHDAHRFRMHFLHL